MFVNPKREQNESLLNPESEIKIKNKLFNGIYCKKCITILITILSFILKRSRIENSLIKFIYFIFT